MDYLELALKIVDVIRWPAVVLIVLLIIRYSNRNAR
jgi:hypothetical protein